MLLILFVLICPSMGISTKYIAQEYSHEAIDRDKEKNMIRVDCFKHLSPYFVSDLLCQQTIFFLMLRNSKNESRLLTARHLMERKW